jgi:hypothetical protein
MASLLGGASLLALVAHSNFLRPRRVLTIACRYEWLFWIVVAAIVLTGVGNVGLLGAAAMGPGSHWGDTLTVKLTLVVALLVLSLFRTALVVRLATIRQGLSRAGALLVEGAYATTAAGVAAITYYAVRMAHG